MCIRDRNLVFVIYFHMDVAGVALATVISQCISAALVVRCLMKETGPLRLDFRQPVSYTHLDVYKRQVHRE